MKRLCFIVSFAACGDIRVANDNPAGDASPAVTADVTYPADAEPGPDQGGLSDLDAESGEDIPPSDEPDAQASDANTQANADTDAKPECAGQSCLAATSTTVGLGAVWPAPDDGWLTLGLTWTSGSVSSDSGARLLLGSQADRARANHIQGE